MRRPVFGKCRHANELVRRGAREGDPRVERWHDECPGRAFSRPGEPVRECACPCHAVARPTLAQRVDGARRERMIAAGIDPDAPSAKRDKGFCRHNHEMTPDNTGPRGECRTCKRDASQRCKARRAEREAAE